MRRKPIVVPGFRFGSVQARIRLNRPDLALIVCDAPAAAAGVFTQNQVRAAPVLLSEKRLRRGQCQAIVVNSGCANACTGPIGAKDADRTAAVVAEALGVAPALVCVASTGVIGRRLPMPRIEAAIPKLVASLKPEGLDGFSRAILTTDHGPKVAFARGRVGGARVTVAGCAKGAGMIAPNMATMLGFVVTDAAIAPKVLRQTLREVADRTFNAITVDGDTSTNDSVYLLASGLAGNAPIVAGGRALSGLRAMLEKVCAELARAIVSDGEGATKVVRVIVSGAADTDEARTVAREIAESPLVKTAIHGADPNWGRILGTAGNAGVPLRARSLSLDIGGVPVVRRGVPVDGHRPRVRSVMLGASYDVRLDLGRGGASAHIDTCDLSTAYVRINAAYST